MGTHYAGTDEETRALNAFIALVRAANSLISRLNPYLAACGLTESQFGVMEALYHLGPMCQRELGAKTLKSAGNMTLVVDNLEKLGYVKRERSSDDRRFVMIHLTEQGETFLREILPQHVGYIVREIGILKPEEQEELRRLCRIVGRQTRDLGSALDCAQQDECHSERSEESRLIRDPSLRSGQTLCLP